MNDRLATLGVEIAAVEGRVHGRREKAALASFVAAAEAYKNFLRFRDSDADAGGMVLLRGASRPIALRYQLPIVERGGGRWVRKTTALDTFRARADTALADAAETVGGRRRP